MSEPPSLRKTSSFMPLFYRMNCLRGLSLPACKRQYNLDVYEHGLGRRHYCRCVCAVRVACRARRDSFDSICAQGCFLPHTPGIHGNRLAVADRGVRAGFIFRCLCNFWQDGRQSNFSAATHAHCNHHVDPEPDSDSHAITDPDKYTHCDSHTQ